MSSSFLNFETDKYLEVFEVGNKDLKSAVVFFFLDIDTFFNIVKKIPLEKYRVLLILKSDEIIKDLLVYGNLNKSIEYVIKNFKLDKMHCVFESGLEEPYKIALCENPFLKSIIICSDFDELCRGVFLTSSLDNKNNFLEDVSNQISNVLSEGEPFLIKIANKMKLTPWSLSQKIKKEGSEFRLMVKKQRYKKAIYLLKNPEHSLANIAYMLGYTEQSAFTRAFKEWAGCSPRQFRKYYR